MLNKSSIKSKILDLKLSDFLSNFLSFDKNENKIFSLCPFHKEKTPSFYINDKKQLYYCFGCKKGGNIINFIMEYKKLNFYESLNFIINFYNLNKYLKNNSIELSLLKKIINIYKKNLYNHFNTNKNLNLFIKKRKLTKDIIDTFQIGFAPNEWNFILKRFSSQKKILLNLGLIKENKNNIYDKFRNMIIFPIKDKNSNIIGFGGRNLIDNIKPKYINSNQSELFDKSNILFNLDLALKCNLNKIYIVEGYFDVISMYSIGIKNVVSTMGTTFSIKQFNILKKMYKKIIFCYDGDKSGVEAQFKIAKNFINYLDEEIYIGFINLPQNEDPDSMINFKKKDDFENLIKKPMFILDYIFFCLKINKINIISNKVKFNEFLYDITKFIKNELLKNKILNYLNKKYFENVNNKKDFIKKKILSLYIKASIILIKKQELINFIDYNTIIKLSYIREEDVKILLKVINVIKKNDLKNKTFIEKLLNENKSFSLLVEEMPLNIAKEELINIIKKCTILIK